MTFQSDVLEALSVVLMLAIGGAALRRSRIARSRHGLYAAVTGFWLTAWGALVFSALLLTLRDSHAGLALAAPAPRAVFSWALFGGAWLLARERLPGWIVPTGFALGGLGVAVSFAEAPGLARAVWLLVEVPPLLASGVLLALAPVPPSPWSRALPPLLLGMAAVLAAPHLVAAWRPDSVPVRVLAWLVAPLLFAAQLRTLADANRERLRRERDVLERRFAERTEELAAANRSLRREVDRHRATEEALRSSEERHRIVSEVSSDFSFEMHITAERGVETEWVSGSFERITGRPPEALEGWGFVSLLAPEQQEETRALVAGVRGIGRTMETEHEIERPDGDRRLLNIRVVSIEEAGGGLRVVGGARDVTEARRAEEARRELEMQVQDAQRLESLGVLTGGIAHDFNNLLAVVLGNLRLAVGEIEPDSVVAQRLQKARAAGEVAARLTEQMLAYSGKASLTLAPTNLSRIATEMADLLRASLPETASLEFDVAPEVLVTGDETRLRQVLLNLVANAGEALPAGRGHVEVRIRALENEGADARGTWWGDLPTGPSVLLEVSDDGSGMDADLQRRIFDPFFSTKFSGRGLGLASVLGIVRSHGGAIRVESKPERGTVLSVRLQGAESAERADAAAVGDGEAGAGHVLVIDDDEGVLELAAEFLARTGHTAVTALGGREGVECFRSDADGFDVVLLDLGMPDLDGGEVFAQLRRIDPDVRVVLTTGYREEHAAERFEALGVGAFLGKPYSPEELARAIATARA